MCGSPSWKDCATTEDGLLGLSWTTPHCCREGAHCEEKIDEYVSVYAILSHAAVLERLVHRAHGRPCPASAPRQRVPHTRRIDSIK